MQKFSICNYFFKCFCRGFVFENFLQEMQNHPQKGKWWLFNQHIVKNNYSQLFMDDVHYFDEKQLPLMFIPYVCRADTYYLIRVIKLNENSICYEKFRKLSAWAYNSQVKMFPIYFCVLHITRCGGPIRWNDSLEIYHPQDACV